MSLAIQSNSPCCTILKAAHENVFLNVQILPYESDSRDLSQQCMQCLRETGDSFLAGYRYLFSGRDVKIEEGKPIYSDSYRYDESLFSKILKTFLASITLPFCLILACLLKGLSFLCQKNLQDYRLIASRTEILHTT